MKHSDKLTSSQKDIYYDQLMYPNTSIYNIGAKVYIRGEIDKEVFQDSYSALVEQSDALRSYIRVDSEGEPYLLISNQINSLLNYVDFSSEDSAEQLADDFIQQTFSIPFDLTEEKMLHEFYLIKVRHGFFIFFSKYHHVITDGWGTSLIYARLTAFYNDLLNHKKINVVYDYSYCDYIKDDQEYNSSDECHSDIEYWKKRLKKIPKIDHVDFSNIEIKSERKSIYINRELYSKLILFCKKNNFSVFHALLAILYTYFSRTQEKNDLIIGVPILNRRTARFKKTIGLFTNILPFLISFKEEPSFVDLAHYIKDNLKQDFRHQRLSLGKIIEATNTDEVNKTLINLYFSYEKHNYAHSFHNCSCDVIPLTHLQERAMLSVYVREFDESKDVKIDFDYNLSFFNKELIHRFSESFEVLLNEVISEKTSLISELNMLGKSDLKLLATNRPKEHSEPIPDKTIHTLFEEQVTKSPDKKALKFKNKTYTYTTLNNLSNQVAHYLLNNKKVKVGALIGVCLDRSERMVIGILGILKAGGAYVPIDPEQPTNRKQYIVNDSEVKVIITEDKFSNDFPGIDSISLSDDSISKESTDNPDVASDATSPIYAIYTSGTTGYPKGAVVSHHAIVNLSSWLKDLIYTKYDRPLRTLLTASYNFDASVQQLFAPLLTGSVLILIDQETRIDPQLYADELIAEEIDVFDITPSFLNEVLDALSVEGKGHHAKYCLVGGEVLSKKVASKFHQKFDSSNLINVYGVTEAAVNSSYEIVREDFYERGSIGKALPNTSIFIVDPNLNLQPSGAIGEICVAGKGLATGYLNKPVLTAEKFIANPFKKGHKLYKTGDMGRLLPDGAIQFLGRKDDQVKINGVRTELTEIEHHILTYPLTSWAKVLLRTVPDEGKNLIAYYTSDEDVVTNDLISHLKKNIPVAIIPSHFVHIQNIPLNVNGKIDHDKLPLPVTKENEQGDAVEKESELVLLEIWEEIFGKGKVTILRNFFELGGNSLKAVKLISTIQRKIQVKLELREVFENATIPALAEVISAKLKQYQGEIPVVESKEIYELSHSQTRLWLFDQYSEGRAAYNMFGAFTLRGNLDVDLLEKAFSILLFRHESLRTAFIQKDAQAYQKIIDPASIKTPFERCYVEHSAELEQLINEEATRTFDLERAPLFRVKLLQLSDHEYTLLISLAHIIADGWSVDVIKRELSMLYNAQLKNPAYALDQPKIQYKDYVFWFDNYITEQGSIHQEYWQKKLSGTLPLIDLPSDFKRPSVRTYKGRDLSVQFDSNIVSQLSNISYNNNSSLFLSFATIIKILIFRYTGQEETIIGTPVSGRGHADLDDQIGLYVNNLCIHSKIDRDTGFVDNLSIVKKVFLEAIEHSLYPFDKIVEDSNINFDHSRSPIFDYLLLFEEEEEELKFEEVSIERIPVGEKYSKYDLIFQFIKKNDAVTLKITYNTDLFIKERIDRMCSHIVNLMVSIVDNAHLPIRELEYISVSEKKTLLIDFNNNEALIEHDTLTTMFEDQCEQLPNAVALVNAELKLTYRELNQRANQVAHFLKNAHHVEQGALVGLLMDRSEMMVISMLAILKAGAAYVPIDPDYPLERIHYILQDSSVKVFIKAADNIKIEFSSCNCINILDHQKEVAVYPIENPDLPYQSNDLAYVIYTSGSTGNPKGVMVEHKAIVNRVEWMWRHYSFTHQDVILQKTPYVFDVSVWEFFMTLCFGARLVLCKKEVVHSPSLLTELIHKEKVTTVHFVPSILNTFLNNTKKEDELNFASVRLVVASGEALGDSTVQRFYEKFDIPLHNLYGPTEAAVDVTYYQTNNGDTNIPIGKPIFNMSLYVLDANLKLLPVDVPGEICIAGIGLARGYINKQELTSDAFVDNPFCDKEKLYRTGDIGKWLDDGNIAFIGRKDNQVKIRGYRVELGEVESEIRKFKGILDTIVHAFDDPSGEKSLVSYIISEEQVNKEALREFLIERLPYFSLPVEYIPLASYPLTPNGKLDYSSLPDPVVYINQTSQVSLPLSGDELRVQKIWQEVLGKEDISISDNFFAIGGHSLSAAQLVSRIFKEMNVELSIKLVYKNPTIKALSNEINNLSFKEYKEIKKAQEKESYEMSYAQRRYFILNKQFPGTYNINGLFQIDGRLDKSILQRAFHQLILRHEVLRTTFETKEGETRQIIHTEESVDFHIEEFDEEHSGIAQKAEQLFNSFYAHLFVLESLPLLKVALIKAGGEQRYMMITLPHIVADGWTLELFKVELQAIYDGIVADTKALLAPPSIQYKDYAEWHNEVSLNQEEFWRNMYEESFEKLTFPYDYEKKVNREVAGKVLEYELSSNLTNQLKDLALDQNCTIGDLLLYFYFLLLSKWCKQSDVTAGVMSSGRNHIQAEQLAGVLINFLPVRYKFSETESIETSLNAFTSLILDVYTNQSYPFELMVDRFTTDNTPFQNPFFDTLFNFHTETTVFTNNAEVKGKHFSLSNVTPHDSTSLLELMLDVKISNEELKFEIAYDSSLFYQASIEKLLYAYVSLIETAISNSSISIESLNLFSAEEEKLLEEKRSKSGEMERNLKPAMHIVSSFTADPCVEYINYWLNEAGIELDVVNAPYNQVFQSLIQLENEGANEGNFLVLLIRFEDWLKDHEGDFDIEAKIKIIGNVYEELTTLLGSSTFGGKRCIVPLFPVSSEIKDARMRESLEKLNEKWRHFIDDTAVLNLLDLSNLDDIYEVVDVFDAVAYKMGHVPFTQEYFAALGTFIARKVISANPQPFKVIILDCDNVLWKGICGENSDKGVVISEHHQFLHQFLIEKYKEGFLLALCSKNNESDVWEVFDNHPDILLKRAHILTWRINWNPKSVNLREMAKELNLGLDSFIFIDDSPFECEEVNNGAEEVLTIQSPEDPTAYKNFFSHIWAFDRFDITKEDVRRNEMYKVENERQVLKRNYHSNNEFIKSLGIEIEMQDLDAETIERAEQLSKRTNQFNLNGIVKRADELNNLISLDHYFCFSIHVMDKFGDYGMSGFIIVKRNADCLIVESFFLSCRVLGRGVESLVLEKLKAKLDIGMGEKIKFNFIETGKNEPVKNFLKEISSSEMSVSI